MRFMRRNCRVLASLLFVGGLFVPALFAQAHSMCDAGGDDCDCCQVSNCPERHANMCPSDHHDCVHHTGTTCDWTSMEG
jgi:hypothetical protein